MKTIIEFAKKKNCSRQTVYSAIRRGDLDFTKKYGKILLVDNVKNKKWFPKENMKR